MYLATVSAIVRGMHTIANIDRSFIGKTLCRNHANLFVVWHALLLNAVIVLSPRQRSEHQPGISNGLELQVITCSQVAGVKFHACSPAQCTWLQCSLHSQLINNVIKQFVHLLVSHQATLILSSSLGSTLSCQRTA